MIILYKFYDTAAILILSISCLYSGCAIIPNKNTITMNKTIELDERAIVHVRLVYGCTQAKRPERLWNSGLKTADAQLAKNILILSLNQPVTGRTVHTTNCTFDTNLLAERFHLAQKLTTTVGVKAIYFLIILVCLYHGIADTTGDLGASLRFERIAQRLVGFFIALN